MGVLPPPPNPRDYVIELSVQRHRNCGTALYQAQLGTFNLILVLRILLRRFYLGKSFIREGSFIIRRGGGGA